MGEGKSYFVQSPYPIIVHTHLLTEDWRYQGVGILHKLLEFWNNWPDLAAHQKLIVGIFIKYQIKRPKSRGFFWFLNPLRLLRRYLNAYRCYKLNQTIRQQLDELVKSKFSQFKQLDGVILSELSGISRTHVENWVRAEVTKAFIGEAMLEKLMAAVGEMFEQWELQTSSSTMSMDDLAEGLIELLKPLMSANE